MSKYSLFSINSSKSLACCWCQRHVILNVILGWNNNGQLSRFFKYENYSKWQFPLIDVKDKRIKNATFGVSKMIGSALWKRETIATNTRVCGVNRDGPLKDIIEIQYSRKDEERYMLVLDFHTKDFLSSVIQNIDTSLSEDGIWQCQNVSSFSHDIIVVRELSYYNDYAATITSTVTYTKIYAHLKL